MKEVQQKKQRGSKKAVLFGTLTAIVAAGAAVGAVFLRKKQQETLIREKDLNVDDLPIPEEYAHSAECCNEEDDVCGCFEEKEAEKSAVTPEEEQKICQPEDTEEKES